MPSKELALPGNPLRIVVLVSGSGTNLQALLDACVDPGYGVTVVAVGSDRGEILALDRAIKVDVPTFVVRVNDFTDRSGWDLALTEAVSDFEPDLVVLAGFMKLVGAAFIGRFGGRVINTHPALSPSFPGMHGPRDAVAYGVKVSGCTIFLVDDGIDTGPILAQDTVPVFEGDDETSLHERIKTVERALLVDTVGRMARHGWTIEGRKVSIS